MKQAFGLALIGILIMLAFFEVARYRRAARSDEELPYPRRRLSRRVGISFLFSGLVALVAYWPESLPPTVQLVLLLMLLIALAVGLFLLWRDLHETSVAVVRQAARFSVDSELNLVREIRCQDQHGPYRQATDHPPRETGAPPGEVDRPRENGKTVE